MKHVPETFEWVNNNHREHASMKQLMGAKLLLSTFEPLKQKPVAQMLHKSTYHGIF